MYTMLSEVAKISPFLKEWKGLKSSKANTSNNFVKAFFEDGTDSKINVVLVKQIRKLDPQAFQKMVEETFAIDYQSMSIIVSLSKTGVLAKVFNRAGVLTGEALIQAKGVRMIKTLENLDARRAIMSLVEE